ncbi:MAG: AAA family ATPase [Rhodospirillales bacterium]|nr:AAA family ATPase [Alphaproteobacteria bacterium]MCB1839380.1 AAA family ATPase [Alphaproteobacteria bacterium]MCB9976277.1 AAA family ATPase [Rhodospirillales bacterium]
MAHIIVFGNEKGGSGKSTAAMHTAVALLRLGYKVGSIDLDARQGTFTRYLKKRFDFITSTRDHLPSPTHMAIPRSEADTVVDQRAEEQEFLTLALQELGASHHFIIIDTPGTDSFLSRLAHSHADTLITPMNDSFIDLDLLADIDPDTFTIKGPSIYTKMVQDQRNQRKLRDGGTIDWIVMRNRLASLNARNKQDVGKVLKSLAEPFGFRIAPGFHERVIFKELFLKGLTLLDLKESKEHPLTLSQLTARQEVRKLVVELGPEKIKGHVRPPG